MFMFQPDAVRNAMLNSVFRVAGLTRKTGSNIWKFGIRGSVGRLGQAAVLAAPLGFSARDPRALQMLEIDIFELRNLPLKIELLPDHCGALLADRTCQVSIGSKPKE